MLDREFWVGTEKHLLGREKEREVGGGGGGRGLKAVPSTDTFVQIPNHKTTEQKKTPANSTVSKLRKGRLREVTKCLLTQF